MNDALQTASCLNKGMGHHQVAHNYITYYGAMLHVSAHHVWPQGDVFEYETQSGTIRSVHKICEKRQLDLSCPSVRSNRKTRLPLEGYLWNLISNFFFPKSAEIFEVSLKSDNNNGYFTCIPMYIHDNVSLHYC